MSLDLSLLPMNCSGDGCMKFSHSVLQCGSSEFFYEDLLSYEKELGGYSSDKFRSYLGKSEDGDRCYGPTITSPYGDRLKQLTVGQLKTFWLAKVVETGKMKDCHYWTKATFAFLAKLPEDTLVVLFWR